MPLASKDGSWLDRLCHSGQPCWLCVSTRAVQEALGRRRTNRQEYIPVLVLRDIGQNPDFEPFSFFFSYSQVMFIATVLETNISLSLSRWLRPQASTPPDTSLGSESLRRPSASLVLLGCQSRQE